MTSDSAGSTISSAIGRPATVRAAERSGQPVATVSAAARPAAAALRAAQPMAAARPAAAPALRRPPVIAAAAQSAPTTVAGSPPSDPVRDRNAPLPLLRLVVWEIAIMVGLLAIGRPWWQVAVICGGAGILLGVAATRFRGKWVSTILRRWAGLGLRRRQHDLSNDRDRAELVSLITGGGVITRNELAGAQTATLSRPDELLVVLRPVDTGVRELAEITLSDALRPETDDADPEFGLQLVLHRGPNRGPGGMAQTRAWLAIRARRDVDVLVDGDLRIGLSNVLRKTQKKLGKAGLSVAPLTEQEIVGTLAALTHVGPGREELRETWTSFTAGPVTQVGLRVGGLRDLPAGQRTGTLERLMAAVPSVAVTVAVTTDADPDDDLVVLRVAASSETTATRAAEHLVTVAPQLRLRLERADGLHAWAVAASLPIGGVSS